MGKRKAFQRHAGGVETDSETREQQQPLSLRQEEPRWVKTVVTLKKELGSGRGDRALPVRAMPHFCRGVRFHLGTTELTLHPSP